MVNLCSQVLIPACVILLWCDNHINWGALVVLTLFELEPLFVSTLVTVAPQESSCLSASSSNIGLANQLFFVVSIEPEILPSAIVLKPRLLELEVH